jgi:cytoskeletal protein CcmA (bactofilin family)
MAIWKDPTTHKRDDTTTIPELPPRQDTESRVEVAPTPMPTPATAAYAPPRRATESAPSESVLAAGLNIEGKIEGTGHIRVAGQFRGDVNVHGNLSIERGAKLVGGIHAETVIVGGELEGNITSAARVELLESGVLTGDLKAGSLTVAAGSRMRGRVEFGWEDSPTVSPRKHTPRLENGSPS